MSGLSFEDDFATGPVQMDLLVNFLEDLYSGANDDGAEYGFLP